MDRLAKLLTPYLKSTEDAELVAAELRKNGVIALTTTGSITCKFEPDSTFGTMTLNGETFEVYIGEIRVDAYGMGRDPMTMKMIAPLYCKRKITLIER